MLGSSDGTHRASLGRLWARYETGFALAATGRRGVATIYGGMTVASYTLDFRTGSARNLSGSDGWAGIAASQARPLASMGPGSVAEVVTSTTALIETLEPRDLTDHPDIAAALVALARAANPLVWATSGGEPEFNGEP